MIIKKIKGYDIINNATIVLVNTNKIKISDVFNNFTINSFII